MFSCVSCNFNFNKEKPNFKKVKQKATHSKHIQMSWDASIRHPIHIFFQSVSYLSLTHGFCIVYGSQWMLWCLVCHKYDVVSSIDAQYTQCNTYIYSIQIVSSDYEQITLSLSHLLAHIVHNEIIVLLLTIKQTYTH